MTVTNRSGQTAPNFKFLLLKIASEASYYILYLFTTEQSKLKLKVRKSLIYYQIMLVITVYVSHLHEEFRAVCPQAESREKIMGTNEEQTNRGEVVVRLAG